MGLLHSSDSRRTICRGLPQCGHLRPLAKRWFEVLSGRSDSLSAMVRLQIFLLAAGCRFIWVTISVGVVPELRKGARELRRGLTIMEEHIPVGIGNRQEHLLAVDHLRFGTFKNRLRAFFWDLRASDPCVKLFSRRGGFHREHRFFPEPCSVGRGYNPRP